MIFVFLSCEIHRFHVILSRANNTKDDDDDDGRRGGGGCTAAEIRVTNVRQLLLACAYSGAGFTAMTPPSRRDAPFTVNVK